MRKQKDFKRQLFKKTTVQRKNLKNKSDNFYIIGDELENEVITSEKTKQT